MAFGDVFKAEPSILKLPDFVLLLFHIRVYVVCFDRKIYNEIVVWPLFWL